MLNRPDSYLHRTSALRPQGIPAGRLVLVLMLLLLSLDDHLLQLSLLQHIRQLIVVIKVNHGMLNKEPRTDESQIAILTVEPIVVSVEGKVVQIEKL